MNWTQDPWGFQRAPSLTCFELRFDAIGAHCFWIHASLLTQCNASILAGNATHQEESLSLCNFEYKSETFFFTVPFFGNPYDGTWVPMNVSHGGFQMWAIDWTAALCKHSILTRNNHASTNIRVVARVQSIL